jgi:hypothetical protein
MESLRLSIAPLMPPPPDGVSRGRTGIDYAFTVTTHDPIGNGVSCRFDWGDGQKSDWTDPVPGGIPHTLTHCWDKPGKYDVCVQARNTTGATTSWGPAARVSIA